MSRNVFAALAAVASACGLAVAAGGAVGAVPALAAAASPSVRAARAAGSGVPKPVLVTQASATQANGCVDNPPAEGLSANTSTLTATPWAQTALNFESVWNQLQDQGHGQTVAVIDSGIDWTPQLDGTNGRVTAIDLTTSGIQDCVGHGTAVAGIIGASDDQVPGSSFNPFAGVAPEANILSVKVANQDSNSSVDPQLDGGNSETLSMGIDDAVALNATVLNISMVTSDSSQLAAAIQNAERHNVVVVAASGNDSPGGTKGPFYPASYPGVLSVGAMGSDGSLADFTDPNTQESVTAPGVLVTSTEQGGFNTQLDGTSFATPFVAGVAALMRSANPNMSAAQVVARIEATADGPTEPITGNGMVNPLQALQAVLPISANPSASSAPGNVQPVSVSRAVPPDQGTINAAMGTTAGAVGGVALVAIGGVSISQRRRRRGQKARAPEAKVPADAGLADSPLWE
jgi:membrane-anchored mycosin MYCP